MATLVHGSAQHVWDRCLDQSDRVLVLGASGWFGRTASALLGTGPRPTMFVASTAKDISVGGALIHCERWDEEAVRRFSPTVVIDCAFLTRDLAATMSLDSYVATNEQLTDNMLAAARLGSVGRVVTVSSGAAVYPSDALSAPMEDNPYGWLKRQAEERLRLLASETGTNAVVARAWSVSGAFVQKPLNYALSDMVTQALAGQIHIRATVPVYRRYVSVEDLLAVSLANATSPGLAVIDSGGPLLEMGELAQAVARVVRPDAAITRAEPREGEADRYVADPTSWDEGSARAGLQPHDIDGQIAVTLAGLTAP